MGGAYLTLLNTIANMGVILPKTPLFAIMDALTISTCRSPEGTPIQLPASFPDPSSPGSGSTDQITHLRCSKKPRELGTGAAAEACAAAGGRCVLDSDGFYLVSYSMVVVGLAFGVMIMRLFPRLTRLPLERWRAAPFGNM